MNQVYLYPRFRWIVMATIAIVGISATSNAISIAPLIGVVATALHIRLGTASFGIMGLNMLATAVGAFLTSLITNRIKPYTLFIVSLFVLGTSNALLPWVGYTYTAVVTIRIIEGLAVAPVLVAYAPLVAAWFPVTERGIANGIQGISISIGLALGVALGPVLFQHSGSWQSGLAWLSVIPGVTLLIVCAVASMRRPEPHVEVAPETSGTDARLFSQILRQSGFWAGTLCYCMGVWVLQAFNDLTPGYFAIAPPVGVGFGPVAAGRLMTIVMIAGAIGGLAGGFLSDRFGRRPIVFLGHLFNVVFCASVMLPMVTGSMSILVPVLFFVGAGPQIVNSQCLAFGCSFPSPIVGKTIGLWVSVGTFIGSVGVMVGSLALRLTGHYHASILIVSLVAFVGLIASVFLTVPRFADQTLSSDARDAAAGHRQSASGSPRQCLTCPSPGF